MARILVVDDEVDIVRVVVKILEARGHELESCVNGTEALELIESYRPDVVILDINLPDIDGFEVCRQVKSAESTKDIPVVMMTAAYVSVEDAEKGTELGADEYITKPFLRQVLIHNVERLLEVRRDDAGLGSESPTADDV